MVRTVISISFKFAEASSKAERRDGGLQLSVSMFYGDVRTKCEDVKDALHLARSRLVEPDITLGFGKGDIKATFELLGLEFLSS